MENLHAFSPAFSVLVAISQLQFRYNRSYSYVSLGKLQKILADIYGYERSRRTVSYHLTRLHRAGYFQFWRNRKQDKNGRWYNLPSNRKLTAKALKLLKQLGMKIRKQFWENLIEKKRLVPWKMIPATVPEASGKPAEEVGIERVSLEEMRAIRAARYPRPRRS